MASDHPTENDVTPALPLERADRQTAVAEAPAVLLAELWEKLGLDPAFDYVRGPQTGLVSLRGRIGGGGAPFPFGDATATRASVRLECGTLGHAMLLGRDKRRATIAAVIDALCHQTETASKIDQTIIAPLIVANRERDSKNDRETAATKVDFFTMVRGEDG